MPVINGMFRQATPWQQMQTMDATMSNAMSGNANSDGTLESMLDGGQDDSTSAVINAISSSLASAEQSEFQGYADLAAQAALKRVKAQVSAQQGGADAAGAAPASGTAAASATDPSAAGAVGTTDPLNPSDPTNPFAAPQDVTLDDGTVVKAQTGIALGDGATLDPASGITTMADGTQINSYGVPVKEMTTLPLDLPPGFNVDVTA
jgi:hypothetical protein